MDYQQIELVKYLAKKNIALLLIDGLSYVAKSPDNTEIIIRDNVLMVDWLISS